MGFRDFFRGLFGKGDSFFLDDKEVVQALVSRAVTETAVRELAINIAIGLIAKTISKCELKTFIAGEEYKGLEYYLWNVKPNVNENAFQFWHKLIFKLCFDNEVLVIFDKAHSTDNIQALVADNFAVKRDNILYPKIYTNVQVGELAFNRDFGADEVLYLQLNNENIRRLLDMFYNSYKPLIDASHKSIKRSRGERGTYRVKRLAGDPTYEEIINKALKENFVPYFKDDNVIVPLPEGHEYTRLNSTSGREITDVEDIRKLINDVFDITALAFNIPPALMRREMDDVSRHMSLFITFGISPIVELITTEINAKRYSRKAYLSGDYVVFDTSNVKHIDILEVAQAIEKLISSGATSVNEIRKRLGLPKIGESWADEHWITKNFELLREALKTLEGG